MIIKLKGKISQEFLEIMQLVKDFLLSKWIPRILYISLGVFLGLLWGYILHTNNKDILSILKAMSPFAILLSVMLASRQFVYNGQWNKKDAANKALYAAKENINKFIDELPLNFNFRQMMRNGEIATIQEIHNSMGVFVKSEMYDNDNKVYNFIYHCKEPLARDIQNIHNKDKGYCKEFNTSIDGRQIERAILSILGEYEYICMSCMQDIFDKEAVIELIGPNIVTTFNTMSDYIVHLRKDGRHGGGRLYVYDYFESFSQEIVKYKNNKFNLEVVKIVENRERHLVPFRLVAS